MKALRLEDLSLHHYIKNNALQDFIEEEKNILLEYVSNESSVGSYVYQAQSDMLPLPTSRGRGWVYLDNLNNKTEQTDSVTVYDENYTVISGSNYNIDYISGRIILDNSAIIPATVDYWFHYVSVIDEWKDVQEVSELPIVVVSISKFRKEGFQLGGGKYIPRQVDINLFASNSAERDDITETLYDALYQKSCAYQTFPKGTIIDWDGRFNTNYEYATISGSSNLKFGNVITTTIRVSTTTPSMDVSILSDLNRYRSRISFSMFHWEEA